MVLVIKSIKIDNTCTNKGLRKNYKEKWLKKDDENEDENYKCIEQKLYVTETISHVFIF